jgi:hypothetical protein
METSNYQKFSKDGVLPLVYNKIIALQAVSSNQAMALAVKGFASEIASIISSHHDTSKTTKEESQQSLTKLEKLILDGLLA